MDYAIEILNIELYKWKAIYNEHEYSFSKDPNSGSDNAMGVAKPKIKQMEKAIKILEARKLNN